MQTHTSGVRRLSRGALTARENRVPDEIEIGRKELIAAARDAGVGLKLRPALRLVLGELVGCYGAQRLTKGLVVWPANEYLVRKTGLCERSIRRCVRELVDLALIEPIDSPNRKRYARRGIDGEVVDAFGFNLAPIYARRAEFAGLILRDQHLRDEQNRRFDTLTIHRIATQEAIAALSQYGSADLAQAYQTRLCELLARSPRRGWMGPIEPILEEWATLRLDVENAFLDATSTQKESGSAGASDLHLESNKGRSTDTCKRASGKPVPIVVKACPALRTYGEVPRDEADLVRIARYLRPTIGASPNAWDEASEALGPVQAATLVCYVLQVLDDDGGSGRIKNPGGMFRWFARRMVEEKWNLDAELLALRRKKMT